MKPIIEVEHVTKEFRLGQLTNLTQGFRNQFNRVLGRPVHERAPFKALDDVSFTVAPGEVLGIIGHNGAGKSTILKILAGISQPTRGKITVHGRVAPLIEVGAGLVADMTGRENIFLNAAILGMKRAEIVRKFDEIVDFSELEDFIDTPVKRFSSGMQVKLGFSIATSVESQILIVDEVLAVGDLAFQRKCFDRMESLIKREGRTVLLVSHNIRQVERMSAKVVMLDHGHVVAAGEPSAVCNRFYEYSDDRIVAQSDQRRTQLSRKAASALGTGELELLDVTLLDASGQRVEAVEYQSPVKISIRFKANCELRKLAFGVGVHTPDMVYVANEDSSITLVNNVDLFPGEHLVELSIASMPLLPGIYAFRIGVAPLDTDRVVFYSENLCSFRVVSRETNRSRTVSQGFIAFGGEWNFVGLDHRQLLGPVAQSIHGSEG